jgi:hypothetical protein
MEGPTRAEAGENFIDPVLRAPLPEGFDTAVDEQVVLWPRPKSAGWLISFLLSVDGVQSLTAQGRVIYIKFENCRLHGKKQKKKATKRHRSGDYILRRRKARLRGVCHFSDHFPFFLLFVMMIVPLIFRFLVFFH